MSSMKAVIRARMLLCDASGPSAVFSAPLTTIPMVIAKVIGILCIPLVFQLLEVNNLWHNPRWRIACEIDHSISVMCLGLPLVHGRNLWLIQPYYTWILLLYGLLNYTPDHGGMLQASWESPNYCLLKWCVDIPIFRPNFVIHSVNKAKNILPSTLTRDIDQNCDRDEDSASLGIWNPSATHRLRHIAIFFHAAEEIPR